MSKSPPCDVTRVRDDPPPHTHTRGEAASLEKPAPSRTVATLGLSNVVPGKSVTFRETPLTAWHVTPLLCVPLCVKWG